jgi:hypothetical protein
VLEEFAACWRQQCEFLSTADALTWLRWEATPRCPSATIAAGGELLRFGLEGGGVVVELIHVLAVAGRRMVVT